MTLQIQNSDGLDALDIESLVRSQRGWGWFSGLDASLTTDVSAISIDLTGGAVHLPDNGGSVGVSGSTLTLRDGDANYPRKDVVYVNDAAILSVEEGSPRPAKPEDNTDRKTYSPQPPDMAGLDGVVLYEVWVPQGASQAADMRADYVTDRRIPPWPAAVADNNGAPGDHATEHYDGNNDEIDAANLAGGLGNPGEFLQTDGDSLSYTEPSADDISNFDSAATDAVDTLGLTVVTSDNTSLPAGGTSTVDTGVPGSETATFTVYLGPTDETPNADVAADVRNDSETGTYVVDIEETDTALGPTVEYDIIRLR